MHVCLICIELFGDGVYGGFGRATRAIGRELVKRGVVVTVVVPRRTEKHPDVYELDGMSVRQYRPHLLWKAWHHLRSCEADVYHSQDASTGTLLARWAAPRAAHLVTLRDPLDRRDWKIETDFSGHSRARWWRYRLFIDNAFVRSAVRRANGLYCAAEFLVPKVVRKYDLDFKPGFLPTPVDVPDAVVKSEQPTVCFVGRWQGRKRPDLFLGLAREFPQVRFIAVGAASDSAEDRRLREKYRDLPNLKMTGVLDQFENGELRAILARSWILVNTSVREGLPNSFLEAAAHRCAIQSFCDPDGFASKFGCVAAEGQEQEALRSLLANDRWRDLGEAGYHYVKETFAAEMAIEAHLSAYRLALGRCV